MIAAGGARSTLPTAKHYMWGGCRSEVNQPERRHTFHKRAIRSNSPLSAFRFGPLGDNSRMSATGKLSSDHVAKSR